LGLPILQDLTMRVTTQPVPYLRYEGEDTILAYEADVKSIGDLAKEVASILR